MCAHPSSHVSLKKKASKRDTRARAAAQHPLEAQTRDTGFSVAKIDLINGRAENGRRRALGTVCDSRNQTSCTVLACLFAFACSRPRNFFRSFSLGSHCCSVSARRAQFRARGRRQELAPRRPVGWAASVRSREGSRSGPAPTERAGPRRGRRDEIQGEAQAGGQGASDGLPRVLGRHGGAGAARRRAEARHRRLGEDATRRGLQSAQVRALASARAEQLRDGARAARFPPSFHAADARGTRANADNSRFSSQWRGTTDAREEFFAATRFLQANARSGGRAGAPRSAPGGA